MVIEALGVSATEGNSTNKWIHALSFLVGKHRDPHSNSAKLFLPKVPIGIVACAFTLSWDNLCRNSCLHAWQNLDQNITFLIIASAQLGLVHSFKISLWLQFLRFWIMICLTFHGPLSMIARPYFHARFFCFPLDKWRGANAPHLKSFKITIILLLSLL